MHGKTWILLILVPVLCLVVGFVSLAGDSPDGAPPLAISTERTTCGDWMACPTSTPGDEKPPPLPSPSLPPPLATNTPPVEEPPPTEVVPPTSTVEPYPGPDPYPEPPTKKKGPPTVTASPTPNTIMPDTGPFDEWFRTFTLPQWGGVGAVLFLIGVTSHWVRNRQ